MSEPRFEGCDNSRRRTLLGTELSGCAQGTEQSRVDIGQDLDPALGWRNQAGLVHTRKGAESGGTPRHTVTVCEEELRAELVREQRLLAERIHGEGQEGQP